MRYPPVDAYQKKLDKYYEYSKAGILGGFVRYAHRQRLDVISTLMGNVEGKTMLDAGSGAGANVVKYAKAGAKVTSVDISEEAIEKNNEWLREEDLTKGVTLVKGDILNLPFEEKSFDIIICSEVLEHTHDPYKTASNLVRYLRDGGVIIITMPNVFSLFWGSVKILLWTMNLLRIKRGAENEHTGYSFRNIISICEKAGLQLGNVCSTYIFPLLHFGVNNWLEKKIRFRFPFKYMGAFFIIRASKT